MKLNALTFFLIIYLSVVSYLWGGINYLWPRFIGFFTLSIIIYFVGTIYGKFAQRKFDEHMKFLEKFGYEQEGFHTKFIKLGLVSFIGTSWLLFAYTIRHFGYMEFAINCASTGTVVSWYGLISIIGIYAEHKQYKDM